MMKLRNQIGYTLVELLIATLLTGILAMGGLRYYVSISNSTLTQEDIGEMQQAARNSLQEIAKTMRKAGFKVGTHAPYTIAGDTMMVFFADSSALDTVSFYLAESQLDQGEERESAVPNKHLMVRYNSHQPDTYADNIESLTYTVISASVIDIVITVGVDRPDEDYVDNDGVRTFTLAERVQMRNLKL